MKIFISWSGETSHKVAKVLRDWLPSVIQSITPYVSSEDIDKGARWSSDIASELDESAFGILCVTPENLNAPWLNFEAGALGKSVDKSRVCPFLFRIKRSDIKGPILQFQSTIHEKEDVYKLLKAVNDTCGEFGIEESRLEKAFYVWWPKLDEELSAIEIDKKEKISPEKQPEESSKYISRVLEEILEISRTNQKILRDPPSLLPIDYFEHLIGRTSRESRGMRKILNEEIHPGAIEELIIRYRDLLMFLGKNKHKSEQPTALIEELYILLLKMDDPLRHISNRLGMRLPKEVLDDFLRV